jgi:hypothetical protein
MLRERVHRARRGISKSAPIHSMCPPWFIYGGLTTGGTVHNISRDLLASPNCSIRLWLIPTLPRGLHACICGDVSHPAYVQSKRCYRVRRFLLAAKSCCQRISLVARSDFGRRDLELRGPTEITVVTTSGVESIETSCRNIRATNRPPDAWDRVVRDRRKCNRLHRVPAERSWLKGQTSVWAISRGQILPRTFFEEEH